MEVTLLRKKVENKIPIAPIKKISITNSVKKYPMDPKSSPPMEYATAIRGRLRKINIIIGIIRLKYFWKTISQGFNRVSIISSRELRSFSSVMTVAIDAGSITNTAMN